MTRKIMALAIIALAWAPLSWADGGKETPRIAQKIEEAKRLLQPVRISKSRRTVTYYEEIKMGEAVRRLKREDFAHKEIALALYHQESGAIEIVKIRKSKKDLVNIDERFTILIEPRISGINWNSFNTAFFVSSPQGWIVIANKYPIFDRSKKNQKEIIYSPYSSQSHSDELAAAGREYLNGVISQAAHDLAQRNVKSKTDPKKTVAEMAFERLIHDLVVVEHWDPNEFYLSPHPEKFAERVLVILGANGDAAFRKTNSPAHARGLAQFTRPTYRLIRSAYPNAGLPKDFFIGASDHRSAIKAALLLCDYNAALLAREFGNEILNNENLPAYLAAAYNGGVGRVIAALKAHGERWENDFSSEIFQRETTIREQKKELKILQKKRRGKDVESRIKSVKKSIASDTKELKKLERAALRQETVTYLEKLKFLQNKKKELRLK